MTDIRCTCGPDPAGMGPGTLHSITCLLTAATQPHAMVNDHDEVFYPDNREDAAWFAQHEHAQPLDPERWPW